MIEPDLFAELRAGFALDWRGVHGSGHWRRVCENGLRLAPLTGADQQVIELFAHLHDCQRRSDGHDPQHGPRAAAFAEELGAGRLGLGAAQLELLLEACRLHTAGLIEAQVTIQTCWDADRLDLGRVGIRPAPQRLCTEAARDPELIAWAWARSRKRS